jgi:hypothetical protein
MNSYQGYDIESFRLSQRYGRYRNYHPFHSVIYKPSTPSLTKEKPHLLVRLFTLAGATGLEPATSGVTGRRSNQLNYAPNFYLNYYVYTIKDLFSQPSRVKLGTL